MRSLLCTCRSCWDQGDAQTQQFSSTTIVAKKAVIEVQKLLSSRGATAVMVDYDLGDPVAMKFKIRVDGEELGYRVPVNWQAVLGVMPHDRLAR
jgi:hypothetical protein